MTPEYFAKLVQTLLTQSGGATSSSYGIWQRALTAATVAALSAAGGGGGEPSIPKVLLVTTDGDDATGTPYSLTKPYSTLRGAVDASTDGDVVLLAPGVYSDSTSPWAPIYLPQSDQSLSIVGAGQDATRLNFSTGPSGFAVIGVQTGQTLNVSHVKIQNDNLPCIAAISGPGVGRPRINIGPFASLEASDPAVGSLVVANADLQVADSVVDKIYAKAPFNAKVVLLSGAAVTEMRLNESDCFVESGAQVNKPQGGLSLGSLVWNNVSQPHVLRVRPGAYVRDLSVVLEGTNYDVAINGTMFQATIQPLLSTSGGPLVSLDGCIIEESLQVAGDPLTATPPTVRARGSYIRSLQLGEGVIVDTRMSSVRFLSSYAAGTPGSRWDRDRITITGVALLPGSGLTAVNIVPPYPDYVGSDDYVVLPESDQQQSFWFQPTLTPNATFEFEATPGASSTASFVLQRKNAT